MEKGRKQDWKTLVLIGEGLTNSILEEIFFSFKYFLSPENYRNKVENKQLMLNLPLRHQFKGQSRGYT